MTSKFFSRRIAFFGNIALVILCVVFFLVPFGFRGARMAVDGMRNDVKDWLPKDFKETEELRWFYEHFMGEAFVIVTWPGANKDDTRFQDLVSKLNAEIKPRFDELADENLTPEERERVRAHLRGDDLGLFSTGDFNQNWGGRNEKWLTGDNGLRYFITPEGELYRWSGKSNLVGYLQRSVERAVRGGNTAEGVLIDRFGKPPAEGEPNEFYEDPQKLTARLFKSVTTGPEVFAQLAGPNGSLLPYNADNSDEEAEKARDLAYRRLSGLLFGPVVPDGFSWHLADFRQLVSERRQRQLPRGWEERYERYITNLMRKRFADRHVQPFLESHARANQLDDAELAAFHKAKTPEELERVVFEAYQRDFNLEDELARFAGEPQAVQAERWNLLFAELGRQAPSSFQWTVEDFVSLLSDTKLAQLQRRWERRFETFVSQLVNGQYGGDLRALYDAPADEQRAHWDALFEQLEYPPPTPITWDVKEFKDSIVYKGEVQDLRNAWRADFKSFVERVQTLYYGGDREKLLDASDDEQQRHWQSLLATLELQPNLKPPPRQTCIMLTLSEPGRRDFSKVLGRGVLGKPLGRIHQLATYDKEDGGCGIGADVLRLGGPPVDNVAIDEEGKITLARLVTFSALVGLTLAMLCFRSFKVTIMVFFVGGVSAAASLGIVWWCGSSVDAILMSMPSLIYVLGLSGAVHIVNYYRDAAWEDGLSGAPETAIKHGWFPCTLAAFTTSLGLISLYLGSNVVPIKKFGLFSAIGTMATVSLLFTFLPSALQIWPPGYHRRESENKTGGKMTGMLSSFWESFGCWITKRHWWISGACTLALVLFALGLPKIRTSVHLLKLFDQDARIIEDYRWIEGNLGKLVPMELVVAVEQDMQRPTLSELEKTPPASGDATDQSLQYSFLERAELADRVQRVVAENFGGKHDIVGNGMSTATLIPPLPSPRESYTTLLGFNGQLERHRDELLDNDYLSRDQQDGRELWRISLRLGSLNDIDYGLFVAELKKAVEPVLSAYQYRTKILRGVAADDAGKRTAILVLGGPAPRQDAAVETAAVSTVSVSQEQQQFDIDQTRIFCETLNELFLTKRYRPVRGGRRMPEKAIVWHVPEQQPLAGAFPDKDKWAQWLSQFDSVVLVRDHADYDAAFIQRHAKTFVDARQHVFDPASSLTAAERNANGDPDIGVQVTYTGIVPIVYKAQRTLLESLINSIGLAFVMIAIVMMILLRNWRERFSLRNSLNVGGGLASMIPNMFPIVIIFGAMGHLGTQIDIGTMMTASVAMGVAVDDTIHFLNWYRHGLGRGMDRKASIELAYNRCATAMTQTTLIGGFGLAVFAFSTFTPTQKFGTMMLTLLAAAIVGDLVFLPALLAGPLGPLFGKVRPPAPVTASAQDEASEITAEAKSTTKHSNLTGQTQNAGIRRRDSGHRLPGEP